MRNGDSKCEWFHVPEARGEFWGIWRKSVSWDETCLGGRRLVFVLAVGADEKARIERTFKLKGNKKCRTWTKSSSSVFRVSYVLSLLTFDVRFTHSHDMAMVQDDLMLLTNTSSHAEFLLHHLLQVAGLYSFHAERK